MTAHQVIAELFAQARRFGMAAHGLPVGRDRAANEEAAAGCAKLGLELELEHALAVDERRRPCPRCQGLRLVELYPGVEVPCSDCQATGVSNTNGVQS